MDADLVARDAERQRLAGLYHAIFEVDRRGAAILEDLMHKFAKGPARGFTQEAVTETFVRAHQRVMLDHILVMINLANGVEDESPTTERQSDDDLP